MKNILVATDLSPSSERALGRAAELAAQFDADLRVLHVMDAGWPEDIADALRARAEQAVGARLAAMPAVAGRQVDVQIVVGDPFAEILNRAWAPRTDLLVMATHRKAPVRDLFRGTTVERVLRRADVPTLVVKDDPAEPYRRVLVAVDFSVASRRALELAIRLVPDGEFHVLHAYEVPFAAFLTDPKTRRRVEAEHAQELTVTVDEEVKAFLSRFPELRTRCHLILERGETLQVLSRGIAQVRPDLLAVGTHGRTGIPRALLGSVAEEILANPPCDVVAVKGW